MARAGEAGRSGAVIPNETEQAADFLGGPGGIPAQTRVADQNRWPAVTSRAATAVVSAHRGPSLWTIQAAAGPKPPRAARAGEGGSIPKLVDDRDRRLLA